MYDINYLLAVLAHLTFCATAAFAAPIHVDVTGTVSSLYLSYTNGNGWTGKDVDKTDLYRDFPVTTGMIVEATFAYDLEDVREHFDYGVDHTYVFDDILSSFTLGELPINIQEGPNAYHAIHTRNDDWICCGPEGLLPIDSLILSSESNDEFGNNVFFMLAFNDLTAVGLESTALPDANMPMFPLPLSEVADAWFNYYSDDHHISASLTIDNLHVYTGGAEIAPVPLPSAALLVLFGPLVLFGIRKRAFR